VYDETSLTRFLASDDGRRALQELYGPEAAASQAKRWESLGREFFKGGDGGLARVISSPGRSELGGNHTDHNHGRVLCAAVHMDILAFASPRGDGKAVLRSRGWDKPFAVDLNDLRPRAEERGRTEALMRGVAAGIVKRGGKAGGFNAIADSSVPAGSGLSSSAAFELLMGQLQNALYNGGSRGAEELAIIGKEAENEFFGKPCGLMDQMASALGAISAIDFGDPAKPGWRRVEFDLHKAGYALAIVNAGDSHEDLTDEYSSIPADMKAVAGYFGKPVLRGIQEAELLDNAAALRARAGDRAFLRALHFAAEDARAAAMADRLDGGDLEGFLALVRESGDSSWRLLQNVVPSGSTRSQAVACAIALSQRFLAGEGATRIHGGGFAGTIQAYVPLHRARAYLDFMNGALGEGAASIMYIRPRGAMEVVL
jgi:galactokinase